MANSVSPTFDTVEKSVVIDASQHFQTMKGFGASDCWLADYIGKFWTRQREEISQLLFSTEMTNGKPQGIGLSMWRTNVGGGTAQQGEASGIKDKTRRADSYLNTDLQFDWNRCEGQRYFLNQARDIGCCSIVMFSNLPPVHISFPSGSFKDKHKLDEFADYLAKVAAHYIESGYHVTHISPFNEPQYNWEGGQEGIGWQNVEAAQLIRSLDRTLTEHQLDIDILPGEAGDWEYLYKSKGDPGRSNVIADFFTENSPNYIGNLAHVPPLICAHSYWTDGSWNKMRLVRSEVESAARNYGLELWQTEWSMLGDGYSTDEFPGFDKASEMDIAMYMSKVIHNDLTVANVRSWSYWTVMDVPHWGHKNRFLLISLTPGSGEWGDIEQEGSYSPTSTLWVLGNYSRFIRSDYQRIGMTYDESISFFGSSWISPDKREIVSVISNHSDKFIRLSETHHCWSGNVSAVNLYTTTSHKQLTPSTFKDGEQIVLDPESVTTIVYKLN